MRIWNIALLTMICQCCYSQHWQPLGSGLDNYPGTTEIFTDTIFDKMYVAGPFTQVDGDIVWGIASWNGTDWDSLGHGIDRYSGGPFPPGNTWAMAHYGGFLYIGGSFIVTGSDSSTYMSRWDGSSWSTIPGGQPNSIVNDMQVYNNELYICGAFDSVGNVSANGIAKWNGSLWQSIGTNYNFNSTGSILRMCFYHGNLYIGGFFEDPQGNVCRLAKWDGNNWQFLTTDLVGSIADVHDMEVYEDELYVSGLFYAGTGNNPSNCIMRWNDTTWRDVGGGVDFYSFSTPQVRDMKVHDGKLYCAGNFEKIGGIMAMGLASWDGSNWCGYNTSFQTNSQETGLWNLEFYNDTLYVAGGFILAEGDTMHGISKWIGGSFVDTCGNTTRLHENNTFVPNVKVYPNPCSAVLTFEFATADFCEVSIVDQLGREVLRHEAYGTRIEISVAELHNGPYCYSVKTDNGHSFRGKLIVLH